MTSRNIILLVGAIWIIGLATLIWQGEMAARRGAAQVPSVEIVP